MNKKITAQISWINKATKEFIDAWHQTENDHTSKTAIEKISFKDQALLFKTLTPKRFEILEYVHSQDGQVHRAYPTVNL